MNFAPKKSNGKWIGLLIVVTVFTFIIWGINYSLEPDDLAFRIVLYIPVYVFLMFFAHVLLGAFALTYKVRDELLIISLGVAKINVKWDNIDEIIQVKGKVNFFPLFSVNWPGYILGLFTAKGVGSVRMFATHTDEGFIYLKTKRGFFGITPQDPKLLDIIVEKSGKELQIIDMEEIPKEDKGKPASEDKFFSLLYKLNIIFLLILLSYMAIFYPGSDAPKMVVLFSVIALSLVIFNTGNASRLFQFSEQGGYTLLFLSLAVTGIFFILALSVITL